MRRTVLLVWTVALVGALPALAQNALVQRSPGHRSEGVDWYGRYGTSIDGAGDFNGDGFGDIVIGAPAYNSEIDNGAAHLLFGGDGGPAGLGRYRRDTEFGSQYGHSVTWAGDLDRDGFDDIAVGAPLYSAYDAGKVEIFFGNTAGRLPNPLVIVGERAGIELGSAVAGAGDVDGDGYPDLAVGVRAYSENGVARGAVYLFRGAALVSRTPAWVYVSPWSESLLGATLAGPGDINGDGYADIVAAAPGHAGGTVVVFFGADGGPGDAPDLVIDGPDGAVAFGAALALADVNGDGYSDIIAGDPDYRDFVAGGEGRVHVFPGGPDGVSPPRVLMRGDGRFGYSVSGAGDIDGDGYDDLLVGVWHPFDNVSADAAFLYRGGPQGPGPDPVQALRLFRDRYDRIAGVVGGLGDVNGDGAPDIALGNTDGGSVFRGEMFLHYGIRRAGRLAAQSPAWSGHPDTGAPTRLSAAAVVGDINGDGWIDLLVTNHRAGTRATEGGVAMVLPGGPGGWDEDAPLWHAEGLEPGGWFGWRGAWLGDVNRDGFDDIGISAPHARRDDGAPAGEGIIRVYCGTGAGLPDVPDMVFGGGQRGAALGWDLAGAGDLNGDGCSDILAGAFRYDDDTGMAVVYYGNPHALSESLRTRIPGRQPGSWFGYAVAGMGSLHPGQYRGMAVAAPYHDGAEGDEGAIFIYAWGRFGLQSSPYAVIEGSRPAARLGVSLSSGDPNGDHYPDIIAGAGASAVTMGDLGNAFVFFNDAGQFGNEPGWRSVGPLVGSEYGHTVQGLGDINGDGATEFAVGDPGWDSAAALDRGRVTIVYGAPDGSAMTEIAIDGAASGDRLGGIVAAAGDVTRDGWCDVIAADARGGIHLYGSDGTAWRGCHPAQVTPDGARKVAVRGYSGETAAIHLRATAAPPPGATWIQLQYQVRNRGSDWNDVPVHPGPRQDLATDQRRRGATVDVAAAAYVDPRTPFVEWRVRLASSVPEQRLSHWFYHAFNLYGQPTVRAGVAPDVPPPPEPPPPPPPPPEDYRFRLDVPYPNPFNPDVTIRFELHARADITLAVYDVAGRRVAVLASGPAGAGPNERVWDGRNASGERVASGVYFVRLTWPGGTASRKLVLAR